MTSQVILDKYIASVVHTTNIERRIIELNSRIEGVLNSMRYK